MSYIYRKFTFMAVVSNPLIGRTKQSMGNATFSSWKGINVLKTKATSVANPRSDAQVQQRSAFSQIVSAFRQMPSVIRAGFKKLAVKKSEFNAFMSEVLDVAFNFATPGVATLVPADVKISKGTIASTTILTGVADVSLATIVATWSHAVLQPGQSVSDIALIAAYNATLNEWTGGVTSAARSTNTGSIVLPATWVASNAVTIYLGFSNTASGESGDSDNLTGVVIA
jgi:hypothetical protein